ncbi:hypothetical protein EV360DRAFT_75943 [Lentinula raphanica]|nr:hypothetical protein EV360DRAFT_75943 [Lentinula raphanica]
MNIYRLLLFVTIAVRASAHTITTGNNHPSSSPDHSSQISSRPPSYSETPPLHEGHSENSSLSTQGAGAGASSGIGPGSSVASASSPHPPGTVPQFESAPSHNLSHSRHSSTTTSGDGIRTPSTSTNGGSLREESRVSVESGSGSDPRGPPPPYSSNPVENETTLTTNDGHHSASSQSDTRHSTHSTHPELTHPDTTHSRQSAAAPGQHSGSGSQETGLWPSTQAHERESGPQASSTTAANSYSNPRGRERLNLPVRPPSYRELYPNRRVGFNNLDLEQDPERITSTPRRQCIRRPSDSDSACPTWDGYGSYGSYGYGDGSYGGNGSSGCNTTTMMKKRGVGKERGGGGGEEEDKGTCGVNDDIQIEGPCDCQAATGIIGRDGKLQELPRGQDGKGVKNVKHTKREQTPTTIFTIHHGDIDFLAWETLNDHDADSFYAESGMFNNHIGGTDISSFKFHQPPMSDFLFPDNGTRGDTWGHFLQESRSSSRPDLITYPYTTTLQNPSRLVRGSQKQVFETKRRRRRRQSRRQTLQLNDNDKRQTTNDNGYPIQFSPKAKNLTPHGQIPMNIYRLLLFVTLAVRVSATTTTSGNGIGTSTDLEHPNENHTPSRPPSYSSYTGTLPFPKEPSEKVSAARDHTTSNVRVNANANAGASSGPGPGPRDHDSSTHSDPTHPTHSTHSSTPGSSNTSPEGPGSPRYELSPPPHRVLEPFDGIDTLEQGLGPTRSSHPSTKDRAVRCLVVYGCPTCVMVLGFGAILGIGFGLAASQSGPPCPGPWDMLMNGSYESGGVGGNWTGCNLTKGTGMVTGIRMRMRKRGVGGKEKEDEGMCGVDENTGTIGPDGKIHPLQGGDGKHTKREVLNVALEGECNENKNQKALDEITSAPTNISSPSSFTFSPAST